MISKPDPAEAEAFLAQHTEVKLADLLVPDMNGILRGKQVTRGHLPDLYGKGVRLPGSTYLLDWTGQNVDTIPYGAHDGDPDFFAFAVPGSLAPMPWTRQPGAQALASLVDEDGAPYFADPRGILRKAAQPLYDLGLKIVIAIEYEFYLVTRNPETGEVLPAGAEQTGLRPTGTNCYGVDDLYDHAQLFDEIHHTCEIQNLPAETFVSEYAPGQFEINLHHCDDILKACDQAILLERCIREISRKHGKIATFMAKPFAETAGCGLHVHVSLFDKDGRNIFAHPEGKRDDVVGRPISDALRHGAAGLISTAEDALALYAPGANSFRRLRPGSYAPVYPNWGSDDRTVAIRIPGSDDENIRLEHRIAGADANPYLVVAGVLAGLHHGLSNHLEPPAPIGAKGFKEDAVEIPLNWHGAIDAFAASKIMPEYLGEEYAKIYATARRWECNNFQAIVPQHDYDLYLRTA
ncbi:MAG: glutamine synthetase family protein [Hyphomicrobiales bacterium]